MTPAQIVTEARSWIGVPYVHQGRTRFGVDCIGFVIGVLSAFPPFDVGALEQRNYARHPNGGALMDRVRFYCTPLTAPEDGAMILIRWPKCAYPTHCAIYAQGNLIHAYERARVVIETGFRSHWLRDADTYWRLPGVQ